jgi:hypothetical protein
LFVPLGALERVGMEESEIVERVTGVIVLCCKQNILIP